MNIVVVEGRLSQRADFFLSSARPRSCWLGADPKRLGGSGYKVKDFFLEDFCKVAELFGLSTKVYKVKKNE